MSDVGTSINLEFAIGEDFVSQFFWTDEYNDPIPLAEPALASMKDGNGQVAVTFTTRGDVNTQAKIGVTGYSGFIQLSLPRALTGLLTPGVYDFDMFACVADSAAPFPSQMQQVVAGTVTVLNRVTNIDVLNTATIG